MARKPSAPRRPVQADDPTTPDAVEIAMEALKHDPEPAREVLRAHARLLNLQIASERMSVALKGLMGAAGVALAVGAGWLVWDASRYQGLVVEAFSVPPDLAARGLTGEAVAGQMLDKLVDLQAGTDSVRSPGSYAIDWGKAVEVQIPETGVSIGELQKFLRNWLGKETRISGVVFRTRDGLAVTARTAGSSGATFTGAETDLDGLMQKTAENVYARTQPYRYAIYLQQGHRDPEVDALLADDRAWPAAEQKWRQRMWGFVLENRGDLTGAGAHYRQAVTIDPDMAATWYALGRVELALGHEQQSLDIYRRTVRLFRRGRSAQISADGARVMVNEASRNIEGLTGDLLQLALDRQQALADSSHYGGTPLAARVELAGSWLAVHDTGRAWRLIGRLQPVGGTRVEDLLTDVNLHIDRALLAQERGDWNAAVAAFADLLPRAVWPAYAYALARAGRIDEARAMVARTPLDCASCVRARGRVASVAGDWPGADHWFAEAARLSPSIPQTYADWGESLLARGKPDAAIAKLALAHKAGPRFADPLHFWGRALMLKGDARGAARKFEAAERLAPAWRANRLALAEARRPRG